MRIYVEDWKVLEAFKRYDMKRNKLSFENQSTNSRNSRQIDFETQAITQLKNISKADKINVWRIYTAVVLLIVSAKVR